MGKDGGSAEVSQQDVLQILEIIDRFEQSGAGYLRVEVGDLKVVLSKPGHQEGAVTPAATPTAHAAVTPAATPTAPTAAATAALPATVSTPASPSDASAAAAAGLVNIISPMVGRYYAAPRPGAPPFITAGSTVAEDTTVCLIEVMKLFNAVKAGVSGEVVEVCVADSQFVEYEQVLFRVKPVAGTSRLT